MVVETCHLREIGGYSLFQCRPCLIADLLCVAADNTIRVYSVLSGQLVLILNGHTDTITSLCPHPHNTYQLISSSLDGTVKIWASDDGILLKNVVICKESPSPVFGVKAVKKGIHFITGTGEDLNYW